MKPNFEHNVNKTLQSLDGIERAESNPFLYSKIMNRMQSQKKEYVYQGKVVFRFALLVVVLAGINFYTIYQKEKSVKEKIISEAFASEYFNNTKTFEY
jgi:hypothetical protein